MNRFKSFLDDLTSRWSFLYTATYGAIAVCVGFLFFILSKIFYYNSDSNSILACLIAPFFINGLISILAPITLIVNFLYNNIRFKYFFNFVLICCITAISYKITYDSHNGIGGMAFCFMCLIYLPVTILLFIIPNIVLLILENKKKIKPVSLTPKQKKIALFFYLYNAICAMILTGIFLILFVIR